MQKLSTANLLSLASCILDLCQMGTYFGLANLKYSGDKHSSSFS